MIDDREYRLKVAKLAYKQIIDLMDDIRKSQWDGLEIDFCWDECISVNGNLFQWHELREKYKEKVEE